MPPESVTDLVARAQRGDGLAMDRLLEELMPMVGRICGAVALDDGEDAAQEAMTAIFRGIRGLRDAAALRAWARTVATREAVRAARRRGGTVPLDAVEALLPAPGDPLLGADLRDLLLRLPPEQRAVLVLRDVEGMSESEAAVLLQVPEGTVKSRLSRARSALRRAWSR